jgi:hypothetical protein
MTVVLVECSPQFFYATLSAPYTRCNRPYRSPRRVRPHTPQAFVSISSPHIQPVPRLSDGLRVKEREKWLPISSPPPHKRNPRQPEPCLPVLPLLFISIYLFCATTSLLEVPWSELTTPLLVSALANLRLSLCISFNLSLVCTVGIFLKEGAR